MWHQMLVVKYLQCGQHDTSNKHITTLMLGSGEGALVSIDFACHLTVQVFTWVRRGWDISYDRLNVPCYKAVDQTRVLFLILILRGKNMHILFFYLLKCRGNQQTRHCFCSNFVVHIPGCTCTDD